MRSERIPFCFCTNLLFIILSVAKDLNGQSSTTEHHPFRPKKVVILSEARRAQSKDLLFFVLPRRPKKKQVLRLRYASLRMTSYASLRMTNWLALRMTNWLALRMTSWLALRMTRWLAATGESRGLQAPEQVIPGRGALAPEPRLKPPARHTREHNNFMATTIPQFTPREAARMLGISYPTIKQWILAGKLPTVPTPGGHHRIAQSALEPFLAKDAAKPAAESRERFRRVSGRNQLLGKIMSIRIEGLLAQVVIAIGDQQINSIITADAARELALKKGDTAVALVKSTDVMIERIDEQ
jgi:molybdopterin-binding protein